MCKLTWWSSLCVVCGMVRYPTTTLHSTVHMYLLSLSPYISMYVHTYVDWVKRQTLQSSIVKHHTTLTYVVVKCTKLHTIHYNSKYIMCMDYNMYIGHMVCSYDIIPTYPNLITTYILLLHTFAPRANRRQSPFFMYGRRWCIFYHTLHTPL